MPKKSTQNSPAGGAVREHEAPDSKSLPQLPAAELMSFLKQTRGAQTWTEKELASALKIGLPEAKQATLVLPLQG